MSIALAIFILAAYAIIALIGIIIKAQEEAKRDILRNLLDEGSIDKETYLRHLNK